MSFLSPISRSAVKPVTRKAAQTPQETTLQDPADSYQPAPGIKLGRFLGKAKRVALHAACWVGTAGLVAGAAAAAAVPGGGALLLLGAALTATGAWLTKAPKPVMLEQTQSLSQTYRQTLQSGPSEQRQQSFEVLEQALSDPSAQLKEDSFKRLDGSRGATVRTASNGASILWKTRESGRSLRDAVPRYGQNSREVAAYLVDKRLGHFARVPPSVSREFEGEKGVATLIVDQAVPGKADDATGWLMARPQVEGYRKVAIFDNIIGNLDRHQDNYLMTEQGRVVPIDHGLAFPVKNGQHHSKPNFAFDKTVVLNDGEKKMLCGFLAQRKQVSEELSEHLEPEAITAMFERVEKMIATGQTCSDWRSRVERTT